MSSSGARFPVSDLLDHSAQRYLSALLSGDRVEATEVVAEALAAGEPRAAVYRDVVARAMSDVGHLWEVDELSVADEHMASEITAAVLMQTAPPAVENAGSDHLAVVATVAPETHGLGAQAVAAALKAAGWRIVLFGTGTPPDAVVRYTGIQEPRVVALSVKTPDRLAAALSVAGRLKALRRPPLVLLGGGAVRNPRAWAFGDVDIATDDLVAAVRWLGERPPREPLDDTVALAASVTGA